jgi:Na+/H+-translocating membrane pyrophosphatase
MLITLGVLAILAMLAVYAFVLGVGFLGSLIVGFLWTALTIKLVIKEILLHGALAGAQRLRDRWNDRRRKIKDNNQPKK